MTENVPHSEIKVGSPRSFAIVFCVVFAVIGLLPLFDGGQLRLWSIGVSAVFLFFTFFFTSVLQPLNVLWFRFGMLLSAIVNPLVMLVIYAVAVVPIALVMRLLGKDLLLLKADPSTETYWIKREPPGPAPQSIEQQF